MNPLLILGALWFFFSGNKGNPYQEAPSGYIPAGTKEEIKPTISVGKAKSIASALYEELDRYLTSDAKIISLLKGYNEADYLAIYNQFGVKKHDPVFPTGSSILGYNIDLTEWIIKELSESSIAQLRKMFPSIF
ncbi:hypothetical protein [Flavobacterium microcysteis]|uniref:Uncharacterized protein n=1 Tax=Flavobacterium microcysteis TaxID=2596891 RepID=A0A501QCT1_9FLAO|nr:hypothetical protein [Flavobacterium microcysteis]TPD70503.1 hypothetical protein FJA49_06085 [Flavobacterium microcysteis]